MKVSVIIPTYNRAAIVGEAIASVLGQTYRDFELLIVDDGSTDNTSEVIFPFLRDSRVHYLRQANGGVSAARNTGMQNATGEIFSYLDSDDIWKPEKLAYEVAFLNDHPQAGAVFSDLEKTDRGKFSHSFMRESGVFARMLRKHSYPDGVVIGQREMLLCLLQEVPIKPTAFSIRRTLVEKVGPFSTAFRAGEDREFFLRAIRVTNFGYIDRPLAVLRVQGDALHRIEGMKGKAKMIRLLTEQKKHFSHDHEVKAAVCVGISRISKRVSWEALRAGHRAIAVKSLLWGFWQSGDASLILRAIATCIPDNLRASTTRMLRGMKL